MIYATSSELAGTSAAALAKGDGLNTSGVGSAIDTYNVGINYAPFGLASGTTLTVMQLLVDLNAKTSAGASLNSTTAVGNVFCAINTTGGIANAIVGGDGSTTDTTSMAATTDSTDAIVAGPASTLVFATQQQFTPTGQASGTITVMLEDQNGNVAVAGSDGLTFDLSSSSSGGTFLDANGNPITSVTVAEGQSIASFSYEDTQSGIPTITATGPNFSASQQEILPGAASALVFTTDAQTITVGQTATVTVQLEDQYGYVTTAGSGGVTLTLASSSTSGMFFDASGNSLPNGNITIAPGASSATFEYLDNSLGMPTLSVTGPAFSATQQETVSLASLVYTPAQMRAAYGINNLSLDGTGQTIAIVDAYDNPAIYPVRGRLRFPVRPGDHRPDALPAIRLGLVLPDGAQPERPDHRPARHRPGGSARQLGSGEALDVEWVHAIAPGAKIVLVEADSQSLSDLMASVVTAANQPGVSVVSMSWGFTEGQTVLGRRTRPSTTRI